MRIREHDVRLRGDRVVLRPLTEDDWDLLLAWNNDPEVLYYAEGDDVSAYSLEQIQQIYRGVSQHAFCFIIEFDGRAIGECWLQEMNLERVLHGHPGKDCHRIDLMIGDKAFWGRGVGTEVIQLLTDFAFARAGADLVFGCDIADYNVASLKAFQKAGYRIDARVEQPPESKARYCYDLLRAKESVEE